MDFNFLAVAVVLSITPALANDQLPVKHTEAKWVSECNVDLHSPIVYLKMPNLKVRGKLVESRRDGSYSEIPELRFYKIDDDLRVHGAGFITVNYDLSYTDIDGFIFRDAEYLFLKLGDPDNPSLADPSNRVYGTPFFSGLLNETWNNQGVITPQLIVPVLNHKNEVGSADFQYWNVARSGKPHDFKYFYLSSYAELPSDGNLHFTMQLPYPDLEDHLGGIMIAGKKYLLKSPDPNGDSKNLELYDTNGKRFAVGTYTETGRVENGVYRFNDEVILEFDFHLVSRK
jgi:hypothetical protein